MVGVLVSCDELAAHLDDPQWRIVDCRHQLSDTAYGARQYAAGHLPGAVFLHMDRDLSGPMNGHNGRHPLPRPQTLATTLEAAGITSNRTQVVVYDDDGGMYAGRLWWLLRWLGHDRVAVLDGGLPEWVRQGHALSDVVPSMATASFGVHLRPEYVVTVDEIESGLQSGGLPFTLIDARAADRFRGENESMDPVGGHIPGARNHPFRSNLEGQLFRPPTELRVQFLQTLAGVSPEDTVMYCGSGVTACHNLLALELAGLPGARLYAGSWSEWCADARRPVER